MKGSLVPIDKIKSEFWIIKFIPLSAKAPGRPTKRLWLDAIMSDAFHVVQTGISKFSANFINSFWALDSLTPWPASMIGLFEMDSCSFKWSTLSFK